MPGFVLQTAPLPPELAVPVVRVGFTVSRKVGNAVVRNRVRRRLREIARQVIPETARADYDYVLVGRQGALGRDFLAMRAELHEALRRLKALAAPTSAPTSVVAPAPTSAPTPVAATTATP